MSRVPDHRERVRAATRSEIKETARALLVRDGSSAVTLRAIGREIGMTAPALYRYFPSLEELVTGVCADVYDELSGYLCAARDRAGDDPGAQIMTVCRAFRTWSVAHPAEFGLIFGSPPPALASLLECERTGEKIAESKQEAHQAGLRFAAVFGEIFVALWRAAPFPVPAEETVAPELRDQLRAYLDDLGGGLPLGAVQIFLSSWIRLYGMVAMEVFGHLHFAFSDPGPMFEAELREIRERVGVTDPGR